MFCKTEMLYFAVVHFRKRKFDFTRLSDPDSGRHENFDVDVKNILEHLGLDIPDQIARINTTPKRSFYREYYDTSTKKIVEKIYEKDLNLFDYEF